MYTSWHSAAATLFDQLSAPVADVAPALPVTVHDDYNLFKEKLIARIPKTSTLLGNIPLAHDG